MPRTSFTRTMAVDGSAAEVWTVLTDVPRLVEWVSIVEDATVLAELSHYRAVLMDRLGPFRLRADLDIVVSDVEVGRRLVVDASGEDRQVGSRLSVHVTMRLAERDERATDVTFDGAYEVTGRVASMGSGTINKKATKVIDDFVASAGAAFARR
jgi:carbon monoxide dehydrogenase subunit G